MPADPARAALIRYLAGCIRAELRARVLLAERERRTEAAKRQLVEYDRSSVPTAEQMTASARAAKRRNGAKRRAA
jgi:hypothetical protein